MAAPSSLVHGTVAPPPAQGVCLLVHGGAWDIPARHFEAHRAGLRAALAAGRALLTQGASAVEAAAQAVAALERHGAFDAGCGAVLNRDGEVELDAGLMCGATLDYGAVAGLRHRAQPILVARRLMTEGAGASRILAGPGAERFAQVQGFPRIDNEALACSRERARFAQLLEQSAGYHPSHPFLAPPEDTPHGTVGCVARDRQGRLAAATSTGGTPFRPAGRIGDSPLPGCGYYATPHAAASATGWGEAIAAVLLTGRAVLAAEQGTAPEAATVDVLTVLHESVQNPDGQGASGGVILIDQTGRGAWAYTTPRMARGGWAEGGTAWVDI